MMSTVLPTRCGIATYAHDLIQSLKSVNQKCNFARIELTHQKKEELGKNLAIDRNDGKQYLRACEFINSSDINVVDIQHEFKIFGEPYGENICIFLDLLKKPIVTTLHTVSPNLNEARERIFKEIVKRSDLLYVFSQTASDFLTKRYNKPSSLIEVVPHGVSKIKFRNPLDISGRKRLSSATVFVSSGHMRSAKGYESAIRALNSVRTMIPDFKYLIIGADHPQDKTAVPYRNDLITLIKELNISNHVIFVNKYLKQSDLVEYIQIADIGLLPYPREDQSSSGVLALMIACGKPVVSTPFQFAKAYLDEDGGILSDSFDFTDFEIALKKMIYRRKEWVEISKKNHSIGCTWDWKEIASKYITGYTRVIC